MSRKRSRPGSLGKPSKADPYYFDRRAASESVEFIEKLLKHWQGEWAAQPFKLLPWQKRLVRTIFGTKRRADGLRRYRRASIWVPKKNGKTPLAAAIALLCLFTDDEPGAEVYSVAADTDQAAIAFEDGKQMVLQSKPLTERTKIFRRSIWYHAKSSVWRVLSADARTKHGYRPSVVIFDELHAQAKRDLWDTMVLGVAARRQPLVISISTAGVYDPDSIGWEEYVYAKRVRDGVIDDPTTFALIYEADPEDNWRHKKTWRKANPSLGATLKVDYLETEARKAEAIPAKQSAFRRLHLNVWTGAKDAAIAPEQWAACPEALIHKPGDECFVGMDLSSKQDLTAVCAVFGNEDGTFDLRCRFFLPADNLRQRIDVDRVPYDQFAKQGFLVLTEGSMIDYRAIRKALTTLRETYLVREIAFDPWNASQIAVELRDEEGFEVVEMRQGTKTMSEPFKMFLALVGAKRIRHGGNPLLRTHAANVVAYEDSSGNIKPQKGRGIGRIDGVVASIMGLGRLIVSRGEEVSVYDERGIVTL